jgi:hypothetical protein
MVPESALKHAPGSVVEASMSEPRKILYHSVN